MNHLISHVRAPARCVALETTLLAHGVPAGEGGKDSLALARRLAERVRAAGEGVDAAVVGVLGGRGIVGMTEAQLGELLRQPAELPKVNASNLGVSLRRGLNGATTISATVELAAAAGVSMMATGGLGGVHAGIADRIDISSDLAALARFPVAVVCSGVKSALDVASTRELLETLGVPVIGWGTDQMPAFYLAESGEAVDARFDDELELLDYLDFELARSGRGIVVAQPAPAPIDPARWAQWLAEAEDRVRRAGVHGRQVTPRALAALHEISGGETLRVNLELVENNCTLAGRLASLRR